MYLTSTQTKRLIEIANKHMMLSINKDKNKAFKYMLASKKLKQLLIVAYKRELVKC